MEIFWIVSAMVCGFLVKRTGLPPLIGYLAAGFALVAAQKQQWVPSMSPDALSHFAHVGVLLLLFSIGLKIKVSQIVRPEILGTGVFHLVGTMAIYTPVIALGFDVAWGTSAIIACALSFSSTVLAAKSLDTKRELRAFHGQIAIGILIIQDLFAMILLSTSSGTIPSPYALLLFTLPWTRIVWHKIMDRCGHDELLLLYGVAAAVVAGAVFSLVGLSSELGALVMGVLCAKHEKAHELNQKLWGVKELFLVAFFLTIGLKGLPSTSDLIFAAVMVALLPLQAILLFAGLLMFKIKARNAFLASVSLTTFSEFGLIVAAVSLPEWLIPMAMAVTLSFLLSAPLNTYAHQIFDYLEKFLVRFERNGHHPDEEPFSLGNTKLLILGMGRVGRAAFRAARSKYDPNMILGLDADAEKIKEMADRGYNAKYADAEHTSFWTAISTHKLDAVIIAMDCPDASLKATTELRKAGFKGLIVAHSKYADDARILEEAGADRSYLTMDEAGKGLFATVMDSVKESTVTA